MTISWFRYARHHDVPLWEAEGWEVVGDLGHVHGRWSVLMRWNGPGDPPSRVMGRPAIPSRDASGDLERGIAELVADVSAARFAGVRA